MPTLSVLDLAPVVAGGTVAQALENCRDLARHVERLGYNRFWVAEHHGMGGIASAATSVVIAHVAAGTSTIRVGAGGIMLPNHSPLVIAEQFGTLATLFPGRIDLGLGRAPGSDQAVAQAMRRDLYAAAERFPQDVVELTALLDDPQPGQRVIAVPGAGTKVPLWILGSSLFGAQLAAILGLPFAFASHFAPQMMMEALAIYRDRFEPSQQLKRPYVMLGYNIVAAESDEEAQLLGTSMAQAIVALRSGHPTPLPPPVEGYEESLDPRWRAAIEQFRECGAIGTVDTVRTRMADFLARTGADELMVTSSVFDHAKRLRSFELAMEAAQSVEVVRV